MKKIIAVLLMAVLLCGCNKKAADPYENVEPDFRNVNWGMTIEQVKIREDAELVSETGTTLQYTGTTVNEWKADIKYKFRTDTDSKTKAYVLNSAEYTIDTTDSTDYDVLMKYFELKSQLIEKYNATSIDMFIIYDQYGFACEKISDLYEKMSFGMNKESKSICDSFINSNDMEMELKINYDESGDDESITISYSPIKISNNL